MRTRLLGLKEPLVASAVAALDGHSLDDTIQVLNDFKTIENPDSKLSIVTIKEDGRPNG
jgi:hypothetical protein